MSESKFPESINMELNLAGDREKQMRLKKLMADPWLSQKLDRNRRIQEQYEYIEDYAPDVINSLQTCGVSCMIDLGPGAGELMELCRAWGYEVHGIDSPDGRGGMGEKYVEACSLIHDRQQLEVRNCGVWDAVETGEMDALKGMVTFINSRGSIEQIFAPFMQGPPHHLHHNCSRLQWVDTIDTREAMEKLFTWARDLMGEEDGTLGQFLIHGNGAANTEFGMSLLREAANDAGFVEITRRGVDPRVLLLQWDVNPDKENCTLNNWNE